MASSIGSVETYMHCGGFRELTSHFRAQTKTE